MDEFISVIPQTKGVFDQAIDNTIGPDYAMILNL